MSCTAVIERFDQHTGKLTIIPPSGFIIISLPSPTVINMTATFYSGPGQYPSLDLTNIIDKAYAWFENSPGIRIKEATSNVTYYVNVINATAASPLQVPLACNFCGTETPMTGETYMRLTRGRATAAGPESDVRIVARRRWGDDFTGCSVCNNHPNMVSGAPSISGTAPTG